VFFHINHGRKKKRLRHQDPLEWQPGRTPLRQRRPGERCRQDGAPPIRQGFTPGIWPETDDLTNRKWYELSRKNAGWWFGTWLLWISIQLGMSSSQLTPSFFRGVGLNHQAEWIWWDFWWDHQDMAASTGWFNHPKHVAWRGGTVRIPTNWSLGVCISLYHDCSLCLYSSFVCFPRWYSVFLGFKRGTVLIDGYSWWFYLCQSFFWWSNLTSSLRLLVQPSTSQKGETRWESFGFLVKARILQSKSAYFSFPSVNVYITMERSTILELGKST